MLTATTRCGIRPSSSNSSSPFHFRANTTLGPLPSTQPIPFQTSPMTNSLATGAASPSCQTQALSPLSLALRWRNYTYWNVKRPSDVQNTSCFTLKPSVGPNARLQCASPSALTAPHWPPPGPSPLLMATSSSPTIGRITTRAT